MELKLDTTVLFSFRLSERKEIAFTILVEAPTVNCDDLTLLESGEREKHF